MIRKILTALVAVPLAILLAIFMVANRHAVTVSLDPFGADAPSLSATLPLFVVVLVCLLVGVIAGGTAAWLNQSRWRRAARGLRIEREARKGRLAAREPMTLPARRPG
jgi:uncharacterized integral membrane protein